MIRLHRLEFLVGVRYAVATVGLHEILPEPEAAAVATFGIVNNLAAPTLDHTCQHVGVLRAAHAFVREHLRVVATYMLHDSERLARLAVDEQVLGFLTNLLAPMENQVAGVSDILGFVELALAGFP